MIEWENSDLNFVRRMVGPMKEKFDKYWNECCLVLAVVVVFDPSYGGSLTPSMDESASVRSFGVETRESLHDFDRCPKLSLLAKIARDILVVPATTVASEAAFSIGGRVIDESRACLLPDVVEVLVVADDWIGSIPKKSRKFVFCLKDFDFDIA
ncbi:UNVERIFIED_CONTAM: putative AC transposase [Sesamum calycinum]|uniref:AC transposase n=1 Tax=Sesamum calycinum TaxID=2727403 RepID=A0AAW2LUT0_9LAMI